MEKLLLEIACAATTKRYDFWIPAGMRAGEALRRVAGEICAFEQDPELLDAGGLMLYSCRMRAVLEPDRTMAQCGVGSGDLLLLA